MMGPPRAAIQIFPHLFCQVEGSPWLPGDGPGPASSAAWCSLMEPTHPNSSRPPKPIWSFDSSSNLFLEGHPNQATRLIS